MAIARRSLLGGMLVLSGGLVACRKSGTGKSQSPSATPSPSATLPAEWQDYHAELERLADAGEFSGTVLVAKDGKPFLTHGYGLADRARKIPNDATTKFCVASIGKAFTGVAIARLAEQRKLAFDDPVGKHVPGLPAPIADTVTIHHLLTHTSGMGDILGTDTTALPPTVSGLTQLIAAQPPAFAPGTQFAYSNSGFITLGAVIEHLTGETYADHMRRNIFTPAGMTDTDIRTYKPAEVPNMAHGHELLGADGNPLPPPTSPVVPTGTTLRDNSDKAQLANPSGGALSTVTDLFNFARAVTENRLLGPEMTNTVLTGKVDLPRTTVAGPGGASGAPTVNGPGNGTTGPGASPGPSGNPSRKPLPTIVSRYAYGFSDDTVNGTRVVGHNGGTPGYEGQLSIYPERNYTVVVLANQDQTQHPMPAIRNSQELLTR